MTKPNLILNKILPSDVYSENLPNGSPKIFKIHKNNHFRKDYENSKNAIFLKMHAPFVMIRVDLIMFNRGHAECITSLLGCLLKYSHQTHLALEDLTFHLSLLMLNFRKKWVIRISITGPWKIFLTNIANKFWTETFYLRVSYYLLGKID